MNYKYLDLCEMFQAFVTQSKNVLKFHFTLSSENLENLWRSLKIFYEATTDL